MFRAMPLDLRIELSFFFFQAEDGIRDVAVTGVQTCALPISDGAHESQPGPERGDRLPHAQPGIHLSDVDDHQGSGPAGRRPRRPGASRDRPPAGGTPAGLLPMKLAQRVGRTAPSATPPITAEAKSIVARGVDVID